MVDQTREIIISEEQIKARIAEMAEEIRNCYQGEEVLLVGILKGSLYFIADLSRQLDLNVQIDFVQVSSYEGKMETSANVQIRKDLDSNIEGRNVLLVEDIVDTGLTLSHLRELLMVRKPKTLKIASLLSKRLAKGTDTMIEFIGFEIADQFVVGYGLDYGESYRNLPDISIFCESSP